MNKRRVYINVIASFLLGAALVFYFTRHPQPIHKATNNCDTISSERNFQQVNTSSNSSESAQPAISITKDSTPTFTNVAPIVTLAVVHIKSKYEEKIVQVPADASPLGRLFKEFFGQDLNMAPQEYKSQPQPSTGSGVIISDDGYIVTNNHVIEGADQIEVTLDDNRRYVAKLVGQDASTDLALLKIQEQKLPFLKFGDSDSLQIGEWILAVGNPFNLTSTVTKGIVSAKSRKLRGDTKNGNNKMQIESFIQTDAAVNPGNSGGALVNMNGELVGINTAILAPNGSFIGHSFAIPSSIVKEVVSDLKKYGVVHRAILGISIRDVNADLAEEKGLKQLFGVYVAEVPKDSAAAEAGIRAEDVIVAINGKPIKNGSQLYEQIVRFKPDDKVKVTFYRKDKEYTVTVKLKNLPTPLVVHKDDTAEVGGIVLANVDLDTQKKLNITNGGVCVKEIKDGPWKRAGIQKGFIIISIDKRQVKDVAVLSQVLGNIDEVIFVYGLDKSGKEFFCHVDLRKPVSQGNHNAK